MKIPLVAIFINWIKLVLSYVGFSLDLLILLAIICIVSINEAFVNKDAMSKDTSVSIGLQTKCFRHSRKSEMLSNMCLFGRCGVMMELRYLSILYSTVLIRLTMDGKRNLVYALYKGHISCRVETMKGKWSQSTALSLFPLTSHLGIFYGISASNYGIWEVSRRLDFFEFIFILNNFVYISFQSIRHCW